MKLIKWLWFSAAVVAVLLYAASLYFGELNQDEGWYLYAARMVSQGCFPYVDFAYTQGPVMPFVYVLAQPLVDWLGLAGGRLFTAVLGFACVLLASWLAYRLASRSCRQVSALLAFCLAGVNVYQAGFSTMVKTYSLCGLFVVAGFLVLTFAVGRRAWLPALIAGGLLALAAGTRVSAVVVIPVVFAVLFMAVVQLQKWQDTIDATGAGAIIGNAAAVKIHRYVWLWFGLGAVAVGLFIFLPFAVKAPAALWFALVEYHAGRQAGGLVALLAYKAGFVSRMVQAYFVPVGLLVAGVLYIILRRGAGSVRSFFTVVGAAPLERAIVVAGWLGVVLVSVVHLLAAFPYEDYQVMIFPLFSAMLAVLLAELALPEEAGLQGAGLQVWLPLTVLVLCVAASFSSPVNQGWFVGQRDRIWWPLRKEAPLRTLQRAGGIVRAMTRPGDILLTQDLYLAVEAGLQVPRGLELGPFSYFPFWGRDKATACHVLNRDMMVELLNSIDARVAAFSGYGFSIGAPAVVELPKGEQEILWQAVESRFCVTEEVPCFGQADTTLKIMRRKM